MYKILSNNWHRVSAFTIIIVIITHYYYYDKFIPKGFLSEQNKNVDYNVRKKGENLK